MRAVWGWQVGGGRGDGGGTHLADGKRLLQEDEAQSQRELSYFDCMHALTKCCFDEDAIVEMEGRRVQGAQPPKSPFPPSLPAVPLVELPTSTSHFSRN